MINELVGKILDACYEVNGELGSGFAESVYENALALALKQKGLRVENQIPLKIRFRGVIVGEFHADLLVEDKVLIELKSVAYFADEHFAQMTNYLKATETEIGLLVNFGNSRLECRKFENQCCEKKLLADLFKI
jgi:GxxExxY protein